MVGMNETSVVGTYQNYNTQKADSRNTYGKTNKFFKANF